MEHKFRQHVLKLRPTQFAVGMLEVDEKIAIVREYRKRDRRRYVSEHFVPVVISPTGEMYVVDHHHFLCVCYHLGIKKVEVKVVKDFSRAEISYSKFWKWMAKNRNSYPFCQFGEGPRKALYLPRDIRGLADDPHRSIAWFVRKAGAFENSEKNFAEFNWDNFFRERGLLEKHGPTGMKGALKRAAKLAQSSAAKDLPGFGKLHLGKVAKVRKKICATSNEIHERILTVA